MLDGSIEVYDGDAWRSVGTGDFLHVPPGGIHGFRNIEGVPASMLLLFAPGAPREGYFEGLATLAAQSPEEQQEFMLKHDNIWLD